MKPLFFVAFFTLIFNNASAQEVENNLVGKWYFVSVVNDGIEDIENECDRGQYIHFFPNGKIVTTNKTSGTCDYEMKKGTYKREGDTLSLVLGEKKDEKTKFSILSQDEKKLTLEMLANGAKFELSSKKMSGNYYPALASGKVNDSSKLWGKWFYVSEMQNGEEKIKIECDRKQYLHFFPSGKIIVKNGYPTSCSYNLMVGTYQREGGTLNISLVKYKGRDIKFQIVSQDNENLVLEAEMGENHMRQELKRKDDFKFPDTASN